MKGEFLPFDAATRVHKGPVYESLISDSDFNPTVEALLGVIFPAFAALSERMFKDHLEGGIHADLDPNDPKYSSVPKSNKYAECVFGLLDHLITQKPNISTLASEAYIMYSQNKTSQWLKEQTPEERRRLVDQARRSTRHMRRLFEDRKNAISERKRQAVAARIREREAAEKKKIADKEKISSKMIEYGLWQSVTEVEEQVASYPLMKDKVDGLKAQLRFRQKVLDQKSEQPTVYNFTKLVGGKRQALSVDELVQNVKLLVQEAAAEPSSNLDLLVSRRVRHKFVEDGEEV
jgi:hypothetical protein